MEALNNSVAAARNALPASSDMIGAVRSIAIVVIGIVILYYAYRYLFAGAAASDSQAVVTTAIPANPTSAPTPYSILPVYEGGEYTITFWAYVTGVKSRPNVAKHILELVPNTTSSPPDPTSTLVVALGPHTNNLIVRVNTNATGSTPLTAANVSSLLTTPAPSGPLLSSASQVCDLPAVELQRWVCFGIVLNGRTVDVYMDGKLTRSCVLPSFFTVDANGVKMKILDAGGFDGFLSNVYVHSVALNPDQIYRIYMNGPQDTTDRGFWSWIGGMFDVKGQVTYKYPEFGVRYPTTTVTF
jgi:hypothetical protein